MPLHLPLAAPDGLFLGESGPPDGIQTDIVLDDGQLQGVMELLLAPPAIDHDVRLLSVRRHTETSPPDLSPAALLLEYTAERRNQRLPRYDGTDGGEGVTQWVYQGHEINVQERVEGQHTRRHVEEQQHYDGTTSEQEVRIDVSSRQVYDFDWERPFVASEPRPSYSRGRYAGDADITRTAEASEAVPAPYRVQEVRLAGAGDTISDMLTLMQMHVRNVWLTGYLEVGQTLRATDREFEVTFVYEREDTNSNDGYRSRVDAWVTFASLKSQSPAPTRGARELVEAREFPADERHEYPLVEGAYIRRHTLTTASVLRDVLPATWPEPPPVVERVFTAAGGRVTVDGPHTFSPQRLEDSEGKPEGTLTAFGHTFEGGTWAAIRDAPLRDERGQVTDWERVLVLHASANTVTAVRMDGQVESIPREQFEREVLRVESGEFLGFSPVGTLFHSWPHDWAWCVCRTDTRAVTLHEAWRDSQVTKPKPNDAPPPGPEHWYWKARPRKRPRRLPASAPRAPLRLTLADIAAPVLHDEPLKRGDGPLLLPETATAGERDVRRVVAKRVYYPPAEWDEELDDRTSTTGPLRLTFKLPDPPRTPQGDDPGEDWAAALVLRLKTAKLDITVNGETIPLGKLGHNAGEKRGWHPYVVPVPVTDTYTLTFQGQCSRALLCVRKWPKPSEGGAS